VNIIVTSGFPTTRSLLWNALMVRVFSSNVRVSRNFCELDDHHVNNELVFICLNMNIKSILYIIFSFHLRDCGFDSRYGLMTLMWKESTLYRKSWFFSGYSGFLPHAGTELMLKGWVGIIPLTDPSTVAVVRDQTWVIRWCHRRP
jgi:hypothetical protein